MRDGLTFPSLYHFQDTQSLGAIQKGSSQSSTGKRKSIDKGSQAAKRPKSLTSTLREEENEATHDTQDKDPATKDAQAEGYKRRTFSCLVISPAGRAIKEFRSVKELLSALRDAFEAHRSLLGKANILHRDISENNIIITEPETAGGFCGMLIDLDLAIVDGERTGAQHMTGTMEFMAIDVLRGVEVEHTYRHDLESFFYVLLWICARRAWEMEIYCKRNDRPIDSELGDWYGDKCEKVANKKLNSTHTESFERILMEFAPALDCTKMILVTDGSVCTPIPGSSGLAASPIPCS
ncbi:hypothetical protein MMC07_007842 [Pseudocyphellaria aurata]|nr:hypothetical protein [Pseudocyphellaria aurata]